MAGGTLARTAHFALHRVMLESPHPVPSSVPDSLVDSPADGLLARAGIASPVMAQQKPQTAPFTKPLFDAEDVWIGAMVPKRWAKRAVTRNAIKRQIYNVGALAESSLKAAAHVVRLRAGFDKAAYPSATSDALKAAVRQELVQLFARAVAGSQQTASRAAMAKAVATP
jgi:ribonuclease P protein component